MKERERIVTDLARRFTTVRDFRNHSQKAYHYAWVHGLLQSFVWLKHVRREAGTLSFGHCREAASMCGSLAEFRKRFPSEYAASNRERWTRQFAWLERTNVRWNPESVAEEARKYSSLVDFCTLSRNAYYYAWKNGLIDSFSWLARSRKRKSPR